ncbi:MAG: oligosaccharide flippase family protein [Solirubrobacteraceae bacterium]
MTDDAMTDDAPERADAPDLTLAIVQPDAYALLDSREAGGTALRGGMLRTAGFAGGLLIGLVSAPLVVRHLGDAEFGRYSAVLAVIAIVTGLTEGGVNTVALRELASARGQRERDRVMRDLLGLRIVLSAVGVAVAVGFSALAGYGGSLVLGTLLGGLGMLLSVTQTLLAAELQARLRFGLASAIDLGRALLTMLMIIALVLADAQVLAFLAILVPAGLLSLLATSWLVRKTTQLRPAFHPRRWMPLMRQTVVFAVAVAVNSLYFRVTLVVMSVMATPQETGHFAISFRVMEVLVGIPFILTAAAFPIISRSVRDDRERFEFATGRLFELCALLGVLTSMSLALAAPFIIQVLVGTAENPATDILRIQAIAMIASFIASGTGYPLLGLRRHREALVANILSLVVVVVLALVLVPPLGGEGGALAAVIADFTLASVATAMLVRRGGPSLPFGVIPVALTAGAAGFIAGFLVGIHPLVQTAVGVVVFLATLTVLGRFPPEVRETLGRRRPAQPVNATQ